MTVDTFRLRLDEMDTQGWRQRWQQARREGDSRKMEAIVRQVNRLLTDLENRSAREAADEHSA